MCPCPGGLRTQFFCGIYHKRTGEQQSAFPRDGAAGGPCGVQRAVAAVLPAGGDSGGIHPGAVCRGLRQEVTSRKEFLKAFKRDWKQAIAIWLPMLALLALLVLDVSVGAQFPVPWGGLLTLRGAASFCLDFAPRPEVVDGIWQRPEWPWKTLPASDSAGAGGDCSLSG